MDDNSNLKRAMQYIPPVIQKIVDKHRKGLVANVGLAAEVIEKYADEIAVNDTQAMTLIDQAALPLREQSDGWLAVNAGNYICSYCHAIYTMREVCPACGAGRESAYEMVGYFKGKAYYVDRRPNGLGLEE